MSSRKTFVLIENSGFASSRVYVMLSEIITGDVYDVFVGEEKAFISMARNGV